VARTGQCTPFAPPERKTVKAAFDYAGWAGVELVETAGALMGGVLVETAGAFSGGASAEGVAAEA
jgi:hypothetical protein